MLRDVVPTGHATPRARGRTARLKKALPAPARRPLCSYPGGFPCGMLAPDCECNQPPAGSWPTRRRAVRR